MRRLISLGLSCQSRFCIDFVSAEHRQTPFDYNVTTTDALLRALRSDGEVFHLADEAALRVHRAPKEGREGVDAGGLYLWHDFDLNGDQTIAPDWRSELAVVREKYAALWRRFRALLSEGAPPITFVLSNTQINLGEYATDFDDFSRKFRFTRDFVDDLRSALIGLGATDPQILLLNRYLRDSIELNHNIAAPWFRSVFCGPLTLPTDARLAVSILDEAVTAPGQLQAVCRRYGDGWRVVQLSEQSAAITKDGQPAGELRPMRGGYIGAFEGGADAIRTAVIADDGGLYWSDKSRWTPAG